MDTVNTNKSFVQPKTMAELLPGLSSILSKDSIQTLTAKKQPRATMAVTRTADRNVKPLTIAEMRADILALKVQSPRRFAQPTTSTRKKIWNSSVKLDGKTKSHTADGQLKHNSVRKVLNFQPKPKTAAISKTVVNTKTPLFTKPEFRAKKSMHPPVNPVRISGICKMPETPIITNKITKPRMTLVNKENFASAPNLNVKLQVTPVIQKKSIAPRVPYTPLANMSWISGSDTSFLQKEKEAQEIEDKSKALIEEPIPEKDEVSPPVSTPFKEYRSVQDFFDHSNDIDNSINCQDNTITCFDKVTISKENSKREESVIVSLCDLLCKASVKNTDQTSTELHDLVEVEKQIEHNMKMIENGIKTLTNIKESQMKSLKYVKKLINEKRTQSISENENNNTLVKEKSLHAPVDEVNTNQDSSFVISKPTSVIKLKSPSYRIPKKNVCLTKKIFHKSMPNVTEMKTPNKNMDERALNMYMQMKEQMNFLNTPLVKYRKQEVPDTPAVTSHNLQMQLDKLYKDNT